MQEETAIPAEVAARFDAISEPARSRLLELRALVLKTAEDEGVDRLEETLKWGQPAYVPGRQGTTIRLGEDDQSGGCKLYVHCQTTLVDDWRSRFGSQLTFEGNRAILIKPQGPLPEDELTLCIASALTYHAKRNTKTALRNTSYG